MTLLTETIESIGTTNNESVRRAAAHRINSLTMPCRALGRLLDLAEDLAEMTGTLSPKTARKRIVVMAADHGVAAQQVSQYPQEVTGQMVRNFVRGGAAVNVLARTVGAEVTVVDMGVAADLSDLVLNGRIISKRIAAGTADIALGPAMSRADAVRCVEAGIDISRMLSKDVDVLGTGDMGIANTTPSSAIVSAICDVSPAMVTGRGTGIDNARLAHKVRVIEQALSVNKPDPSDGMDVLAKVGGFEIGGIAGLILGAASLHKPVIIDGFISMAGALIAHRLCPAAGRFMIAAHKSKEAGHGPALDRIGLRPLLDLELRLGEGTGGALAMPLIDAAVNVLTKMATFDEAGVATAEE